MRPLLPAKAFADGYLETLTKVALMGGVDIGKGGAPRDYGELHNQNSDVPLAEEQQAPMGQMGVPQMGKDVPSPMAPAAIKPAGNPPTGAKPKLGYQGAKK